MKKNIFASLFVIVLMSACPKDAFAGTDFINNLLTKAGNITDKVAEKYEVVSVRIREITGGKLFSVSETTMDTLQKIKDQTASIQERIDKIRQAQGFSDFLNEEDDSYNFVITNNNEVAVVLHIGSFTFNIPANSSVTLQSTTDLDDYYDDIVKYRTEDIVCYFTHQSLTSTTTVALAEQTILAPVINPNVADNNQYNLGIINNNLYPVTVKIDYSSGQQPLEYLVPANSTYSLNDQSEPALTPYATNKYLGILDEDVTCYFTHATMGTSLTTMIWEADI